MSIDLNLLFIENIGNKVINSISSLYYFSLFLLMNIIQIFNYHNYNSHTFKTLIIQIYRTSVTILPLFSFITFVFGSTLIGTLIVIATEFKMQVQIGFLIVSFVLNELSPLFTAIFISLRSGTLINKKIAHTQIEKESDFIKNIVLPRIIAGVLSTISLSLIFAMIMISSGYIFTFYLLGMDVHTYKHLIFDSIELSNIMILLTKSFIFGLISTVIAIYSGLKVAEKKISNRTSIINMIINTFLSLFFIEMLSLLLIKLI